MILYGFWAGWFLIREYLCISFYDIVDSISPQWYQIKVQLSFSTNTSLIQLIISGNLKCKYFELIVIIHTFYLL